jgi:asparagine synthase (glutamine-hydrolysing)
MCGITGYWSHLSRQSWDSEKVIDAMTTAIAHRGPDDMQSWLDHNAGVALGHRRLSIIDLSLAGRQPMLSADGRYVIVYNGEIYNHRDIRRELEAIDAAPTWKGHSDTEVLLAAISHWGLQGALERSNGMFALALWDKQARELTLARDRMGEKPLYYGRMKNSFLFGSELKALTAHPDFEKHLDRNALTLFLRHNYIPAPHCIWQGILKLPQAHYVVIRENGTVIGDPICYWNFSEAAQRGQAQQRVDEPQLHQDFEILLKDAVFKRMDADVPMGAFLSGGIDSSMIAALMQAQSSRPVRTFSMGFHEKAYNEAEHGKAVAVHLGTDHTELYVSPEDALDVVPRLPLIWDEPFADSSQIPTLLLCELTRKYVTVSLSGDAGDELFGGYNRYFQATHLQRALARWPQSVRRAGAWASRQPIVGNIVGLLNDALPLRYRQMAMKDRLPKLASLLETKSDDELYRRLVSHFEQPDAIVIGAHEPKTLLDQNAFANLDFAHRMMALDSLTYLPDDILVKVDRASMAVSLEARVPFLDHRLVEFAWKLPLSTKISGGSGKHIVRELLYKHVPKSLVDRPKMGFGVPIEAWLKGPLKPWAEALLDESKLRQDGIFQPEPILKMWQEHKQGLRRWHSQLWTILMFQAWWASVSEI